jgi:alanine-glyoxylate transaminase/serine-glyoxylate transaminase/serine-pyruvate transaminase
MTAPLRSHLDPEFVLLLDDVRVRLRDLFKAPDGHFTFAVSGTGTTGMDAAAVNLMERGMTALCVVNGYFGDRLARILSVHGAFVERLDGEWGRAIDPAQVERAMSDGRFDVLAVVHGETSTGVLNPVGEIAAIARQHDVLLIVDAVTSLGAVPVEVAEWAADVCYSCSQKGVGAPSGLAPITFSARARQQRYARPAFSLDVEKLEDFWGWASTVAAITRLVSRNRPASSAIVAVDLFAAQTAARPFVATHQGGSLEVRICLELLGSTRSLRHDSCAVRRR